MTSSFRAIFPVLSVSLSGNSPPSANETLVAKPVMERPPSYPCVSLLPDIATPAEIRFVSSTGQATKRRSTLATRAYSAFTARACRPTIARIFSSCCPITAQFTRVAVTFSGKPTGARLRGGSSAFRASVTKSANAWPARWLRPRRRRGRGASITSA